MQKTQNIVPPTKVAVLLFESFSNYCLANAVEPLRAANDLSRRALYDWEFVSIDGGSVRSSSGLVVHPHRALSDHPGGAFVFVIPSYGFEAHSTPDTRRALRAAARRFDRLVAMDMGSWLLADAGLLEGRRATIHWDEFDRFAERFDTVDVRPERVVQDGDILSCGGASTAFELVQGLIEEAHGAFLRLEVAALFMQQMAQPRLGGSSKIDTVVSVMRQSLEHPLPIAQIAHEVGLSRKRLETLCQARLGLTPSALYRRLRLRAARHLVETTDYSVEEIALRSGYQNASAMTRAFRAEFETTPTALRRA